MRFWDLPTDEVEAADAEPWNMPLAGMFRPFGMASLVRLSVAAVLLLALSGVAGLYLAVTSPSAARHPGLFLAFNVVALSLGTSQLLLLVTLSVRWVRRTFPVVAVATFVVTPVMVTTGFVSGGPELGVVAVAYVQGPLFAFYLLQRRCAVLYALFLLGCLALALGLQDGWAAPTGTWAFVAANVIGTGVLVGQIAATLADRVAAQVAEIGRLGGLRRFLSPQVAEAMLSGEAEDLTRPHRRQIAVFFCDLRGFTAFTNKAEPEEVVAVLDEYYGAVGGLLQRYGATVGDYAGDGIMAYFGDPVPRDDAALVSLDMTRELGPVMAVVVEDWRRRGYDLDYGVGIALGYATLGVVGFDGRYDYKPVGPAVNLAARLCSKAGPGEVLLDHATYAATGGRHSSHPVDGLELKGFGDTLAYRLAPA